MIEVLTAIEFWMVMWLIGVVMFIGVCLMWIDR